MTTQTFLFFVEFNDGHIDMHHSLTKAQAQHLYRSRKKSHAGVRRFGWKQEDAVLLTQEVTGKKATITT